MTVQSNSIAIKWNQFDFSRVEKQKKKKENPQIKYFLHPDKLRSINFTNKQKNIYR